MVERSSATKATAGQSVYWHQPHLLDDENGSAEALPSINIRAKAMRDSNDARCQLSNINDEKDRVVDVERVAIR